MKKKYGGALLIASTLIWGAVIIGAAAVLRGTEYKEAVTRILYIGVIVHMQLFNIMLLWTKKKKNGKASVIIILSAIIWGAVLIGTSIVLKDTPFKDEIRNIISGASTAHLLFIWAPIGIIYKKEKKQIESEKQE
jgi:NADH:ubiquinone oxidoreductase subunit 6 (subunit J)